MWLVRSPLKSQERPDAGGIGIRTLRSSRMQCVPTRHTEMCQRSRPAVPDDAAVVENFLKLCGGSAALFGCQVCVSANVGWIETGKIGPRLWNQSSPFATDGCVE